MGACFLYRSALRARPRPARPHCSACLSEHEVLLSCAPFNATQAPLRLPYRQLAPRRCACALRALSILPERLRALRSRAHLPRLAYSSRATSARFASLAIILLSVLYNFLAPNVEKRLFHNLRSKITKPPARVRHAPPPVQNIVKSIIVSLHIFLPRS